MINDDEYYTNRRFKRVIIVLCILAFLIYFVKCIYTMGGIGRRSYSDFDKWQIGMRKFFQNNKKWTDTLGIWVTAIFSSLIPSLSFGYLAIKKQKYILSLILAISYFFIVGIVFFIVGCFIALSPYLIILSLFVGGTPTYILIIIIIRE